MSEKSSIFNQKGFYVERGLFTPAEVDAMTSHFMELRKEARPMDFAGVDSTSTDPLKRYPRMIHMHHWDQNSLDWALDARLGAVMSDLLGESPFMVQTMLYYKPAGARGQALHQDQFYLRAQPGTCCAAWIALDDCDTENGCMQVVPGTQDLPILCTIKADTKESFTDVTVPIPDGLSAEPVEMKRGDVLFFNGSVIHGSFPNTSADRFRRSFICHYVTGDVSHVAEFYHPCWRMDGTQVELANSEHGGRCGVWVDEDGHLAVELVDPAEHDRLVRHE